MKNRKLRYCSRLLLYFLNVILYICRDSADVLKQIIKNVCYDIHQNMCRIKPYLKRTFYGIFKYFPQKLRDFAAKKAEKRYKNQLHRQDPIKKQHFIDMPYK